MTLVLVPRQLLTDAKAAIETLADEVAGKHAAKWDVVNAALVGLGTALRAAAADAETEPKLALQCNVCHRKPDPGEAKAGVPCACGIGRFMLSRECGCIPCICEDPVRCHGCGAKTCDHHRRQYQARHDSLLYPDRTCPVCHEDRNMYGGCKCNGYTVAPPHRCPLYSRCQYNDRCPPDTMCSERVEAEKRAKVTVSERCRQEHVQACHACDDGKCCDNQNPEAKR